MIVIIPARLASTRLPGKPLVDICGKPLIQHVYERACESGASRVMIATDDLRIEEVARSFEAEVVMTDSAHPSGTDRIAEVIRLCAIEDHEIVVNVQGDEPLMPPALIDQVAETLASHDKAVMATAGHVIESEAEYLDPNIVKLVTDEAGYALYFTRSPIPHHRDGHDEEIALARRHIGIYAYRAGFVARYAAWPTAPLERAESLEQLRVLYHGERIAVCEAVELPGPGVDTPADLEKVRAMIGARTGS